MSIVRPESGLRAQTPLNLDLDVGVIIVNFNLDELFDLSDPTTVVSRGRSLTWVDPNGTTQTPTQMGATQGGIEYTPGVSQRQVEVDGRRSFIKGLWRVDMVEPTLKMNILEARDPDLLQKYHGAAIREQVGFYARIRPDFIVDDDRDYWWNLVVIQTVSGYSLPKLYIIQNPHVSTQESMSQKDKSETVLPITVTGNTTSDDPFGDVYRPAELWTPSISGS